LKSRIFDEMVEGMKGPPLFGDREWVAVRNGGRYELLI